jgi:hypothetical protein
MSATIKIQETIWERILTCPECEREFDMADKQDVAEYSYGHDCEA